jgi:hypothetical protein
VAAKIYPKILAVYYTMYYICETKTNNMNVQQILAASKTMTFEQANALIEKSGLNLSLIREMRCERLWRVEGNKEICYITNCYKSLVTGMSEVKVVYN